MQLNEDPKLKLKKRLKGTKISAPVPNPRGNVEYDLF